MTLCIKTNNIDFTKITINNKKKFNEKSPVIYYPLNYNYDYNMNRKLYILTDWIGMDGFDYKYFAKKLEFKFINNELDDVFNKIKYMIKINNLQNSTNIDNITNMANPKKQNDFNNNESDSDSDSDSDIDSDSDSDFSELVKKSKAIINKIKSKYVSEDEKILKKYNNQNKQNNQVIDYNNLIKLDINNINNNQDENQDNIKKYNLNFNYKSSVKLIPSKKSGLAEYELNKRENYNEITKYFPTINKKNTNFKIVGKFLLYINVFCLPNIEMYNNIKVNIVSGELKYEKTFVENDILKSKGIYDDKIKIEI
jgi:hypothetical protein